VSVARLTARVRLPHALLAALCAGVAVANAVRLPRPGLALLAVVVGLAAVVVRPGRRAVLLALALALAGWWWGSVRLEAIDSSPLSASVGRGGRARVVVSGPSRVTRFEVRVPARMLRFGDLAVSEPVQVELPRGRFPPQGAVLDVLGVLARPKGSVLGGFDERAWLRRHGIHVIFKGDRWRVVGHRGGIGGIADRIREHIATSLARGVDGERFAVLAGVVLGEDEGLSAELRDRFRASGLYHLLAVSGQNVALVAGGVLLVAWLLGIPRFVGEVGALAGIGAYVLAVGPQPSVVRAGIAGALTSLAWICAREGDRWWFLLLGAVALLAWNPYTLLDPGFQLSFAAVVAIFVLAPRLTHALEGYPVPHTVATFLAVSIACGVTTAPLLWLQFQAVPLLAVPANALAAPAVAPLLGLALAAAALMPLLPSAALALVWLDGWAAAYLALCARLVGGLPFAQLTSGRAGLLLLAGAAVLAAYAWQRWRRAT
jgi:competence protein ComEC